MSSKTRAQLAAEIVTQIPDNTTELITPAMVRGVLTDMVDSANNLIDGASQSIVFSSVGAVNGGINSVIIGSPLSVIAAGVTNSIIIGGTHITVTQSNTTSINGTIINAGQTLKQTLTNGNLTGGNNIKVSAGDLIISTTSNSFIAIQDQNNLWSDASTNGVIELSTGSADLMMNMTTGIIIGVSSSQMQLRDGNNSWSDTSSVAPYINIDASSTQLQLTDGGVTLSDASGTNAALTISTSPTSMSLQGASLSSPGLKILTSLTQSSTSMVANHNAGMLIAGGAVYLADRTNINPQVTLQTGASSKTVLTNDGLILTTPGGSQLYVSDSNGILLQNGLYNPGYTDPYGLTLYSSNLTGTNYGTLYIDSGSSLGASILMAAYSGASTYSSISMYYNGLMNISTSATIQLSATTSIGISTYAIYSTATTLNQDSSKQLIRYLGSTGFKSSTTETGVWATTSITPVNSNLESSGDYLYQTLTASAVRSLIVESIITGVGSQSYTYGAKLFAAFGLSGSTWRQAGSTNKTEVSDITGITSDIIISSNMIKVQGQVSATLSGTSSILWTSNTKWHVS